MKDKFIIANNNDFDFEKAYKASFKDFHENSIIKAKVIDINEDIVFLDFGYKSEAKISTTEFEILPKIGDEVDLYLIRLEGKAGEPVVSKKIIDNINNKKELKKAYKERELIKGVVKDINKSGVIVEHKSIKGFIPLSLFGLENNESIDNYLNKEISFYIERLNLMDYDQQKSRYGKNDDEFTGNRKKFLMEENNIQRKTFFEERNEGDVVKGTVKSLTDFGAFIDLGSVDALLRIKDASWDRLSRIDNILKIGQEIEVKILSLNKETKKLTVGLKQLQEDPWIKFSEQFNENDTVNGTVVSLVTYGAFVKIIDGIEGLLHISDMSWIKKINNPAELLKVGQKVELKIIKIDKENKKVSLSLKHLLNNPWEEAKDKYKVGSKVKGKIKNITTFGFFIELEEGIDALLHIDDISWTETIKNPHKLYNVGDEIETVVIQFDTAKQKIKVSLKQLSTDPWNEIREKYKNGDIIECEIEKIEYEKGLYVKITDEISTFIPLVHVGVARKQDLMDQLKNKFKAGDKIQAVITNLDLRKRKINVSIKEYQRKEEREKVENFMHDSNEDSSYTIGDALKYKNKND